ncbi:hypothetical protein Taro_044208 [Colocasia esculenta]|uniref:Uncharacterized protein n=1 Tax=Colocasia esculenta TaxID=4460 RepID=A0A843X0C7_COLES|nr:hypothetical protein [Colocasia esculenta]
MSHRPQRREKVVLPIFLLSLSSFSLISPPGPAVLSRLVEIELGQISSRFFIKVTLHRALYNLEVESHRLVACAQIDGPGRHKVVIASHLGDALTGLHKFVSSGVNTVHLYEICA